MRKVFVVVAAIAALGLSACAENTVRAPVPGATSSAPSSPAPTVVEIVETFAMPTTCADILPPSRLRSFIDADLVLLGGPGGLYGDDYLLDESPEQEVGGITCIWGSASTEISSVTVSVAPLDASHRANIVDSLIDQGLNEQTDASGSVFWQQGDTQLQPAIVNVLRSDSWISVIQTLGGIDSYAEAELIAAEVYESVYLVR